MVVKLGNLGGGEGKKNIIIPRGLTQKHATTKKYVKNLECFFFVITAKNIYQNGLVSHVDIGYRERKGGGGRRRRRRRRRKILALLSFFLYC